jgi:hypothetical protein
MTTSEKSIDPEQRFTGLPALTEKLDGDMFRLMRDVTYHMADGRIITVRVPFEFDWASIPWFLQAFYPPTGIEGNPYDTASIVHDWLIEHKAIAGEPITRSEADDVFLEIMLYTGVRKTLAYSFYWAVSANTFCKWINPWGGK